MEVAEVETEQQAGAPEWSRRYPPLIAVLVGLFIAIFVLPSSLTLPQTNPTQTLEYAPLPPNNDQNPPPQGNLSALGLGASSGIQGEGAGGGNGGGGGQPNQDISGIGKEAKDKRCVYIGGTQHQTEDPLSPPCVSYFNGDNFGATYQGVTKDEVRILVYSDPITYTGASDAQNNRAPANRYYDVDKSCDSYSDSTDQDGCNFMETQGYKTWERYFNSRFQTYKRHVHLFVYYSDIQAHMSPSERQAEAAENYERIKPFAIVSFAGQGWEDTYLRAMADRGVLNFGSFGGREAAFFNEHPKLIWGYRPSVEQQAQGYGSYVCQRIAGKNSSFAGPLLNNIPRKYGMVQTGDTGQAGFIALADAVKKEVAKCGITDIEVHKSVTTRGCLFQDTGNTNQYGPQAMASLQQNNVTTILWPGCMDPNWLRSAKARSYTPEWVMLGDERLDAPYPITLMQGADELDHHGIVVTPQTYQPPQLQQRCYQAFREADPNFSDSDLGYICDQYKNFFQLFTGIQVAGPRLGPTSIDEGFHAIPQRPSGDPQVPACFYNPGDYTCVKDNEVMWFDSQQSRPGTTRPGCWHLISGGARYLPYKWPDGATTAADFDASQPCNGYDSSAEFTA